jgi:hypothetical protein
MPPAKPWPFEMPTTSTRSPSANSSTVTVAPTSGRRRSSGGIRGRTSSATIPSLLEAAGLRLREAVLARVGEGERYGLVAVGVFRLMLQHEHGPASMTVTGTYRPSAVNTLVIPTLRPMMFFILTPRSLAFIYGLRRGRAKRRVRGSTTTQAVYANCTAPATSVPTSGGSVTANTGNFPGGTETFPGAPSRAAANVVLDDIPQSSLPAPLLGARFEHRDAAAESFLHAGRRQHVRRRLLHELRWRRAERFGCARRRGRCRVLDDSGGHAAQHRDQCEFDVGRRRHGDRRRGGTFIVDSDPSLPGVSQAGNYLVYEPAAGTSTARSISASR